MNAGSWSNISEKAYKTFLGLESGKYVFEVRARDFFFFEQKTAYEMLRRLVGSEMCIRDRACTAPSVRRPHPIKDTRNPLLRAISDCLLYTSDAADDLTRVDLGGRRIIK